MSKDYYILAAAVIGEPLAALVYQLFDYLHDRQSSFKNEFSEIIRIDIELIVANFVRFALVRIAVRKSKRFVTALFSYFIDWRINRAGFRRVIQRLDQSIVRFQIYLNDRTTPDLSSSRSSFFSSITSKSESESELIEEFKSIISIEEEIS